MIDMPLSTPVPKKQRITYVRTDNEPRTWQLSPGDFGLAHGYDFVTNVPQVVSGPDAVILLGLDYTLIGPGRKFIVEGTGKKESETVD